MKQEIQRNCSTHTSSDFKLRVTVNTQDIYKKTDTTNPNGEFHSYKPNVVHITQQLFMPVQCPLTELISFQFIMVRVNLTKLIIVDGPHSSTSICIMDRVCIKSKSFQILYTTRAIKRDYKI